ncbi:MAG: hypothetical protein JWP08_748, partial [Bryobacterales bacterium]|nr:hypothetical protein [Bryobacterales bacterium]
LPHALAIKALALADGEGAALLLGFGQRKDY